MGVAAYDDSDEGPAALARSGRRLVEHVVAAAAELAASPGGLGLVTFEYGAPESVNAALCLCAGAARRLDGSDPALIAIARDSDAWPAVAHLGAVYADVRNSSALDVLRKLGNGAFGWRMASFQPGAKASEVSEYAVAAGLPTVEFNSSLSAGGGPAAEYVLARMAKAGAEHPNSDGESPSSLRVALGWGDDESAYVQALSEAGVAAHASDWARGMATLANLHVHAGLRLRTDPNVMVRRGRGKRMSARGGKAAIDRAPRRAAAAVFDTGNAAGDETNAVSTNKHTVALLMSDGDNVQWLINALATDARWWASPKRGSCPLGWTVSPAVGYLAPPVSDYLRETATPNDELIAAPSGGGYVYPAKMDTPSLEGFAAATRAMVAASLGPPGDVPVNIIDLPGMDDPDIPTLERFAAAYGGDVGGLIWYTYAYGYAGWRNASFLSDGTPLLGAGVSLWGEDATGTMRGVDGTVAYFLNDSALPVDARDRRAYSIVPVNVWGHGVEDACAVAARLEASGRVQVVTPGELMRRLRRLAPTNPDRTSSADHKP